MQKKIAHIIQHCLMLRLSKAFETRFKILLIIFRLGYGNGNQVVMRLFVFQNHPKPVACDKIITSKRPLRARDTIYNYVIKLY